MAAVAEDAERVDEAAQEELAKGRVVTGVLEFAGVDANFVFSVVHLFDDEFNKLKDSIIVSDKTNSEKY